MRPPVVDHPRAQHHRVADDHRRRGHGVGPAAILFAQRGLQVGLTAGAEVCAAFAGRGVESDQPGVQRADEDALAARLARRCGTIRPVHDPAVGNLGVMRFRIYPGIEAPAFRPGFRIDGEHPVEGGREIQGAADQDRRGLKRVFVGRGVAFPGLAGAEYPDRGQSPDIFRPDLRRRREFRATGIIRVVGPADLGQVRLRGGGRRHLVVPAVGQQPGSAQGEGAQHHRRDQRERQNLEGLQHANLISRPWI